MLMIPATPHETGSLAEKRLFDHLRAIPTDEQGESLAACHSLSLTRHPYKRFGEIDFLICGRPGIYVLEVKGGRVACREGVWRYANRYGLASESVEGPFRQAESALHGLMTNIKANLPDHVISQFTIGYGVVFPDCEWRVTGAEWDPHVLADARDLRDFDRWLHKLFHYWRNKDASFRHPDASALKALRRYLRPGFEGAVPLHVQVEQTEERVAALTEDQLSLIHI